MSFSRLIGKPLCLAFGWRRCASSRKLGNPAAIYPARRFWERWPSGRRRAPAKGVGIKSPSRVRIPPSPPLVTSILLGSDQCRDRNEAEITPARAAPKGRGAERRVLPPSSPSDPNSRCLLAHGNEFALP